MMASPWEPRHGCGLHPWRFRFHSKETSLKPGSVNAAPGRATIPFTAHCALTVSVSRGYHTRAMRRAVEGGSALRPFPQAPEEGLPDGSASAKAQPTPIHRGPLIPFLSGQTGRRMRGIPVARATARPLRYSAFCLSKNGPARPVEISFGLSAAEYSCTLILFYVLLFVRSGRIMKKTAKKQNRKDEP